MIDHSLHSYRREDDIPPSAVIDIGSNSVRMVVYEGEVRAPTPMFNEKILCGLAIGMAENGRLSPEGIQRALNAIKRFIFLAESMNVSAIHMIGTAALREASDGSEFAETVARETGHHAIILSGGDEGHYSALGIVSGRPRATGLVGDLGGGSLELVKVVNGNPGVGTTFPLGPLRLRGLDIAAAGAQMDEVLSGLELLQQDTGEDPVLFAVGGAWRELARIHMAQSSYPLRILHEYRVMADDMVDFCELIAGFGPQSLEQIGNIAADRRGTLPFAALVLSRVIKNSKIGEIIFSGNGVREGVIYAQLSDADKTKDPLLEACLRIANWSRRFEVPATDFVDWLSPVFQGDWAVDPRMFNVAAVLSDLNWRVHPDHRASNAFSFALRAPFTAVTHGERVWLALVLYSRYSQNWKSEMREMSHLLEPQEAKVAKALGLGLRLAHTISGGLSNNYSVAKLGFFGWRINFSFVDGRCKFSAGGTVNIPTSLRMAK